MTVIWDRPTKSFTEYKSVRITLLTNISIGVLKLII